MTYLSWLQSNLTKLPNRQKQAINGIIHQNDQQMIIKNKNILNKELKSDNSNIYNGE